jgi:hypothetical protein
VILWPAKAGSALIGTGARTPRRIRGLMRLAIWREKGKVEILSPCPSPSGSPGSPRRQPRGRQRRSASSASRSSRIQRISSDKSGSWPYLARHSCWRARSRSTLSIRWRRRSSRSAACAMTCDRSPGGIRRLISSQSSRGKISVTRTVSRIRTSCAHKISVVILRPFGASIQWVGWSGIPVRRLSAPDPLRRPFGAARPAGPRGTGRGAPGPPPRGGADGPPAPGTRPAAGSGSAGCPLGSPR